MKEPRHPKREEKKKKNFSLYNKVFACQRGGIYDKIDNNEISQQTA